MRIVLTGGGTGGHVTPLLAVASKIAESSPGCHVRYIGKRGDELGRLVQEHSAIERQYQIFAGKLRRFYGKSFGWYISQPMLVLRNMRDALLLILGCIESCVILLVWRPDAVFVKGGYVGLPVGLAAAFLRIPIVTHDSDAMQGLTNRILSRFARAICVGMPIDAYPQYANKPIYHTGVPVREEFMTAPPKQLARRQLKLPTDAQVIVITGGSLGATRINDAVMACLGDLLKPVERVIIWVTGSYHYTEVQEYVARHFRNSPVQLMEYTNDMVVVLAAADVVITRAGATTLAELTLLKKPTIIVPNPYLTGGHQLKNAAIFSQNDAAVIVTEHELETSPQILSDRVDDIINNPDYSNQLSTAMAVLAVADAAQQIAAITLRAANGEAL